MIAQLNAQVSVSPVFEWMCSISYVVSHVCYAVKFLDNLCDFFEFINESIFEAIHSSEFEIKPWSYNSIFDNLGF